MKPWMRILVLWVCIGIGIIFALALFAVAIAFPDQRWWVVMFVVVAIVGFFLSRHDAHAQFEKDIVRIEGGEPPESRALLWSTLTVFCVGAILGFWQGDRWWSFAIGLGNVITFLYGGTVSQLLMEETNISLTAATRN